MESSRPTSCYRNRAHVYPCLVVHRGFEEFLDPQLLTLDQILWSSCEAIAPRGELECMIECMIEKGNVHPFCTGPVLLHFLLLNGVSTVQY